jgi:organic radical activating enzyme
MNLFSPKLHLSESFVSLQGEGKTVGTPAVFWRFKGCGGRCVWCDTVEVWKKGTAYTYEQLYARFHNEGHFKLLAARTHHLVITGGDPLLQQDRLIEFMLYCQSLGEPVDSWFVECENHAVIMPKSDFSSFVDLWNISPKLANSGMEPATRNVPEVVRCHVERHQAIFKFPVRDELDLQEVLAYQNQYHIKSGRIYLMPICSTRTEHERVGCEVARLAIKYGFRFSARLQVVLWDKTVGV